MTGEIAIATNGGKFDVTCNVCKRLVEQWKMTKPVQPKAERNPIGYTEVEHTGENIFEVWCHGEYFRVSSWEIKQ